MNMWHARVGHVGVPYIKNKQYLGLISDFSDSCLEKCEIWAESKLTEKSCPSMHRETKS